MESIWTILGLDPTKDISAIKRAYAEKAKTCHPEEDPQGFLQLRDAYRAALDHAENETDIPREDPPVEADDGEPEDEGWSLTGQPKPVDEGPDPYEDHEAIRSFLDLYTGKQRKDPKRWLDYFTSDAFLDVAWERRFAALLLEHVTRLEAEYPVNREFLNWLCVAYQFNVLRAEYRNPDGSERVEFRFEIDRAAQFDGQEFVFEIATKGSTSNLHQGVERAMRSSFAEYRCLLSLAGQGGRWSEEMLQQAGRILDFYMLGSFSDKKPTVSERHPAGMRLIEHFFRNNELPEEMYNMAWQKLSLKTALMGRAKLLYGGLRERVLEQVPDIMEEELDIRQLNKDFESYCQSVRALEEAGDWDEAAKVTKAFFARPNFQKGLWNRCFAGEHMIGHVHWGGYHFAQEILAFYEQHPDAPYAEDLISLTAKGIQKYSIERRNWEDKTALVPEGRPSLANRPFFRHWINTGFYHAENRVNKQRLTAYLAEEFPWLSEWSRRFMKCEEGAGIIPVPVTCAVGEDLVEIRFHLRYMEFFLNGRQVYRACLPWERVAALADTDTFFFLLPITVEAYDQYESVKAEILRRLRDTAAPEDCREHIAASLADQVCAAKSLTPESFLLFKVFAENEDSLYVCVWFQPERSLELYQQTPYGEQDVEWYDGVAGAESAVTLARQLLQARLFPTGIPMEELRHLPDAVYTQWEHTVLFPDNDAQICESIPKELLGEAVTAEIVETLLEQFQKNRVRRLELSWKATIPVGEEQDYEPRRSLVFVKDEGKYACLYFDDFRAESYALLEKPELYRKGNERSEQVPFLHGRLFSNVVHHNFGTIQRHLDVIFAQVSWPNNVKFMAGGIWVYAEYVKHGRVKYNLDKQLLADFPLEWAHNRPDAPFYFYCYPDSAALMDRKGGVEILEVHDGNRFLLQQTMARFFGQGLSKLRMTWGKEPGSRRHIVLLHENGLYLMAWVQEEQQTVRFHVAHPWAYMDLERTAFTAVCPTDTFRGRDTPDYLLHDMILLRNALDLLLASLWDPGIVTDIFAEYAEEKPVKARPYDALWAELVGDTLE